MNVQYKYVLYTIHIKINNIVEKRPEGNISKY